LRNPGKRLRERKRRKKKKKRRRKRKNSDFMKRSDVQRTAFWYDAHDETDGFVHITVTRRRGSAHGSRFCVRDGLLDRFKRGAEPARSRAHPTTADAPTDATDAASDTTASDTDSHPTASDTDSHADPNADSYSHTNSHTYTDADTSNTDAHPHADANSDADTINHAAKFPGEFVVAAGCLGRDLCRDRNGLVDHRCGHRSGG
jgi:hypothetical protein